MVQCNTQYFSLILLFHVILIFSSFCSLKDIKEGMLFFLRPLPSQFDEVQRNRMLRTIWKVLLCFHVGFKGSIHLSLTRSADWQCLLLSNMGTVTAASRLDGQMALHNQPSTEANFACKTLILKTVLSAGSPLQCLFPFSVCPVPNYLGFCFLVLPSLKHLWFINT